MISYGLAYGMEAYGLSQRLGVPVDEAAAILGQYFIAFPAVKTYMDRTVAEARLQGYTETLLGRRRYLPELASANYRVRQAAERQAMNAGIQGLAADIFKVALVRLDDALEARGLASRIVLQVHDEILVEAVAERARGRHRARRSIRWSTRSSCRFPSRCTSLGRQLGGRQGARAGPCERLRHHRPTGRRRSDPVALAALAAPTGSI